MRADLVDINTTEVIHVNLLMVGVYGAKNVLLIMALRPYMCRIKHIKRVCLMYRTFKHVVYRLIKHYLTKSHIVLSYIYLYICFGIGV